MMFHLKFASQRQFSLNQTYWRSFEKGGFENSTICLHIDVFVLGILTGVSTLIWFIWNYSRAKHIKYIAAYVSFVMLIALLEILDFPPFLWTFDAHSLWHLGTIPTPYFLYKYELRYMHFGCIGVVFYPIFHLLTLDSRLKTAVIFEESLIK